MDKNELTTVQIDRETREKLRVFAAANQRSMAAQIRWWVEQSVRVSQATAQPETAQPEDAPAA